MAGKPFGPWVRAVVLAVCTAALIGLRAGTGEEQLAALSRTAAVEDAWLLVGDTWTDIGFQENPTSVRVDLGAVIAATGARESQAPPAFYHIHPFHPDPSIIEPPSLQDIHSLALMKEACGRKTGAEMTGIIFDGRGKWTFDLTGDLEATILREEHAPTSGGVDDYAAIHGYVNRPDSAGRFDLQYPLTAWNATALDASAVSRNARIDGFIGDARQLGVIVTYTPIEP